jgi:hypothetical protein
MRLRSRIERMAKLAERAAGRGPGILPFRGFIRIRLGDGPAIEEGPGLTLRVPSSAWRDPEAALTDEQRARIGAGHIVIIPVRRDDESWEVPQSMGI